MAQHECVARFYDEHTQDVCNSAGPSTVGGAMKLARRLLDDGRELSKDYEKLQAENKRLERQFADNDAIPLARFAGVVAMLESIKTENKCRAHANKRLAEENKRLRDARNTERGALDTARAFMQDSQWCPCDESCTCPVYETLRVIEAALIPPPTTQPVITPDIADELAAESQELRKEFARRVKTMRVPEPLRYPKGGKKF